MTSKYFKIKNAWAELKNSNGFLDKSVAVGKLVGKGVSNTLVYTVTEAIPELLNQQEKKLEKELERKDLSAEDKAKRVDAYSKIQQYKDENSEVLERWQREKEDRLRGNNIDEK